MDVVLAAIAVMVFFACVSIGGNNAPKAVGVLHAVVSLKYRRLALFLAVFMVLGAALQAEGISETIGNGILEKGSVSGDRMFLAAIFVPIVLIAIALTFLGVPVSMSQITVGSVIGVGLLRGDTNSLNFPVIGKILASWVLVPIASCTLTYLLHRLIFAPLSRMLSFTSYSNVFILPTILASVLISYEIGVTNAGVILGPLVGSHVLDQVTIRDYVFYPMMFLPAVVGISLGIGAISLGEPVSYTLEKKIAVLDPASSFSSQLGACVVVYVFIVSGIPISIGQAIVGGISGIGLVKGMNLMGNQTLKKIFLVWLGTPVAALILSALLYRLFLIV